MKLIIPMAGRGTRLRPHTLITPKPLLKVCGKYILEVIIKTLVKAAKNKITEVIFIVSEIDLTSKQKIINIVNKQKLKYSFSTQDKPLGTAHAIGCADNHLTGEIMIVFADTLFFGNIEIKEQVDSIIWTHKVQDPSNYGVVLTDENSFIVDFKEKPKVKLSDQAIIGLYYFKNGQQLSLDIKHIIKNNIKDKKEYQLTTILSNMLLRGDKMINKEVSEWLDCGTVRSLLKANKNLLNKIPKPNKNNKIIHPCFIGEKVKIINSTIGPNVSIDENTIIQDSRIENSIIGNNTIIKNSEIVSSVIGNNVHVENINNKSHLNLGDYSQIK